MLLKLKILNGLGSQVVKKRQLRGIYCTNREIKAYALFVLLKEYTTSGIIHNYASQIPQIAEQLKCSKATIFTYLNYAEQIGLLQRERKLLKIGKSTFRTGGRIILRSWQSVAQIFELPEKEFTTINYETDNKQKLEHIIAALEFKENSEKQAIAIHYKIAKNPIVVHAFKLFWHSQGIQNMAFTMENLRKAQEHIFAHGASESIYLPLLELVNPDISRSAHTIARAHGIHPMNVAYLKRKLQKTAIVAIMQSNNPVCAFKTDVRPDYVRGRKQKAYPKWCNETKKRTWLKPDRVIVNPFLTLVQNQPQTAKQVS